MPLRTRREDGGLSDPRSGACRVAWGRGGRAAPQLNWGFGSLSHYLFPSLLARTSNAFVTLSHSLLHALTEMKSAARASSQSPVPVKGRGQATRRPRAPAIPRGLLRWPASLGCLWPSASRKLAGLI